ncbi:MAG: putative DNA-binding domain-containing protein [Pseudomonadota bacterium]
MSAFAHDSIVEALLRTTPEATHDPRLDRALAVHRDTVRHALITALRETFPAVRLAVGEDYFDALAAEFVAAQPPHSPVLQEYGDGFASFVAGFPPLHDWPWLADLARIDWARREAYHAADAEPMTWSDLLALDPSTLLATRLELHPALRVLDSPHPLASLWFAHQQDDADGDAPVEVAWNAEACLVWRKGERVQVRRASAHESTALRALSDGRSLLLALWQGDDGAIEPTRTVRWLQQLIDDRLIVAAHSPAVHGTHPIANVPE